ncbi:hypothetical protein [Aliihoeflea sp. PC F10.4]
MRGFVLIACLTVALPVSMHTGKAAANDEPALAMVSLARDCAAHFDDEAHLRGAVRAAWIELEGKGYSQADFRDAGAAINKRPLNVPSRTDCIDNMQRALNVIAGEVSRRLIDD